MYPHLTKIQKKTYFHSFLRGNSIQAYCNLDDSKTYNLEEVITTLKRRFSEIFNPLRKPDANGNGMHYISIQLNKNLNS